MCDCCGTSVDRLWVHRYRAFGVRLLDGQRVDAVAGGWAFCVYCHPLWQRGEIPILAARVASLDPTCEPRIFTGFYEVLAQCTDRDYLTWEAGEPYFKIYPEND
jgi:hypothetical protein